MLAAWIFHNELFQLLLLHNMHSTALFSSYFFSVFDTWLYFLSKTALQDWCVVSLNGVSPSNLGGEKNFSDGSNTHLIMLFNGSCQKLRFNNDHVLTEYVTRNVLCERVYLPKCNASALSLEVGIYAPVTDTGNLGGLGKLDFNSLLNSACSCQ